MWQKAFREFMFFLGLGCITIGAAILFAEFVKLLVALELVDKEALKEFASYMAKYGDWGW